MVRGPRTKAEIRIGFGLVIIVIIFYSFILYEVRVIQTKAEVHL